jgi:putative restriction endonuclease
MALPQGSMRFFLSDALRFYSEDFRLLTDNNPYRFLLNGPRYSAHVSEIHFAARANEDEWRIQIPAVNRELQRQRQYEGDTTLFLGFFPDGKAFTAWEPDYVYSLNYRNVGSVYIPRSDWDAALQSGGELDRKPAQNLGRETAKITLPAEALGVYAENWQLFHMAASGDELRKAMRQLSDVVENPNHQGEVEEDVTLGGKRQKVTATRTAFPRDPKFRESVMQAYGGTCCICGRQLGLVEAAHIIPHSHPDCRQDVSNGLALCVEHHRLYDDALLLPKSARKLHLNLDRVEHLQNIGQGSGLDDLRQLATIEYRVPDDANRRPNPEWLERGVRIRLGTDA